VLKTSYDTTVTDTNDVLLQSDEDTATEIEDFAASGMDPRHIKRIEFMQQVFAYSFRIEEDQRQQFLIDHPEVAALISQLTEIDQQIQSLAAERPLSDINKVDLAILRSIVFEWNTKKTPKKVLIDEAVELAKEFGTESSPKFVNGVLAHLFQ
jgi:transcription antitermination protein NusB